jgi:hypothetical protein
VGGVARRQDAAGRGWWETTGGRLWKRWRVMVTSAVTAAGGGSTRQLGVGDSGERGLGGRGKRRS